MGGLTQTKRTESNLLCCTVLVTYLDVDESTGGGDRRRGGSLACGVHRVIPDKSSLGVPPENEPRARSTAIRYDPIRSIRFDGSRPVVDRRFHVGSRTDLTDFTDWGGFFLFLCVGFFCVCKQYDVRTFFCVFWVAFELVRGVKVSSSVVVIFFSCGFSISSSVSSGFLYYVVYLPREYVMTAD